MSSSATAEAQMIRLVYLATVWTVFLCATAYPAEDAIGMRLTSAVSEFEKASAGWPGLEPLWAKPRSVGELAVMELTAGPQVEFAEPHSTGASLRSGPGHTAAVNYVNRPRVAQLTVSESEHI